MKGTRLYYFCLRAQWTINQAQFVSAYTVCDRPKQMYPHVRLA